MTFPKISLSTIEATAAQAVRKDMDTFATTAMLDLMQEQPELTALINGFLGNIIDGGTQALEAGCEMVPVEFAQNEILKAAFVTYGLTMAAVKAQVEADALNDMFAD